MIKTIDELLDKIGINDDCVGCRFLFEWQEHHPYGMGTATENMAECQAPNDSDCQRLNKQRDVRAVIDDAEELISRIENWMEKRERKNLRVEELERAVELLQEYRTLMKELRDA